MIRLRQGRLTEDEYSRRKKQKSLKELSVAAANVLRYIEGDQAESNQNQLKVQRYAQMQFEERMAEKEVSYDQSRYQKLRRLGQHLRSMSKGSVRRDCCKYKREAQNRELITNQLYQQQSWNYADDFREIDRIVQDQNEQDEQDQAAEQLKRQRRRRATEHGDLRAE